LPIPDSAASLKISIIVPLLNEEAGLPHLLDGLRQSGADECLVVDGGSTDGSRDLLAQSGIRWLTSPAGRAAQMNAGAQAAGGDVLLFLHANTKLDASHMQAVRRVMRDPHIAGGRFDVSLTGSHPALRVIAWFINLRSRFTRISTGDQAIFVRREAFESLKGFAGIQLMEDIEFSRRMKRQGGIACLKKKILTSGRRWEQHGILRTVLLMWRLRLMFWLGVSPEKLAALYREAR